MTFAYRRVERGPYLHNAIAVRADHHFAADAAIRTRGARPFFRDAEFEDAFIFKRAGWAGIDACATGHARALAQRFARIRNNPCRVAAVPNLPDKLALEFIANADATKTGDALRHVHMDVRMRRIRRDAPDECPVRGRDTVLSQIPVKLFLGKLADGFAGIICSQQSQQSPPSFFNTRRMSQNRHAGCQRRVARRRITVPARNVDRAQSTRA